MSDELQASGRRWVVISLEAESAQELAQLVANCADHLIECGFNNSVPEPVRWLPSGQECMWAGAGRLPLRRGPLPAAEATYPPMYERTPDGSLIEIGSPS
jgi:hypothetical protein